MWKPLTVGVLGLWLFAAPFIVPSASVVYNNWLVGLIATNVAIAMSVRRRWERPVAAAAAIWLFVSGFVPSLLQGRALVINDLIVAAVLVVAAMAAGKHLLEDMRAGYEEDPDSDPYPAH
jgi:hypothetical protein